MDDVDVLIREGDTRPDLAVTLTDERGEPVDLSGATVELVVYDWQGTTELWRNDAVPDADQDDHRGDVTYAWRDEDTATSGNFRLAFDVVFADGEAHYPTGLPLNFTVAALGEQTDPLVVDLAGLARRIGIAELTDELTAFLEDMVIDAQTDVENYLRRPIQVLRFTELARLDATSPVGLDLAWDPVQRIISQEDQGDGTALVSYLAGYDCSSRRCRPIARYVRAAAAEAFLAHPSYGARYRAVRSKSAGGQSISWDNPGAVARNAGRLPSIAQPGGVPSIETLARFRRRGVHSARRRVAAGAVESWMGDPVADDGYTRNERTGEVFGY